MLWAVFFTSLLDLYLLLNWLPTVLNDLGATVSAALKVRDRIPFLQARRLARPAAMVTATTPLAEAIRRANEAGAGALVVVDYDGTAHIDDAWLEGARLPRDVQRILFKTRNSERWPRSSAGFPKGRARPRGQATGARSGRRRPTTRGGPLARR